MKWFNNQSRLVQIILLLIPFVNWLVEIVVRWSCFLEAKNHKVFYLLVALVYTVFGMPLGWIDLIWCLLFKHLLLANAETK